MPSMMPCLGNALTIVPQLDLSGAARAATSNGLHPRAAIPNRARPRCLKLSAMPHQQPVPSVATPAIAALPPHYSHAGSAAASGPPEPHPHQRSGANHDHPPSQLQPMAPPPQRACPQAPGGFPGGLPPWLVVPVLRSCQSPIWIWLVNYLHLHLHLPVLCSLCILHPRSDRGRRRAQRARRPGPLC